MNLTLVIMAAGMGSRFGGLKQIEPVGPNNEFIIDYSIYDAKKAGFNKVVFVIKKELESVFKETIGKRLESFIEVGYAYQELEDIPESKKYLAEKRLKPWGTVQAILCAQNEVEGDFVIINADDFYGSDSYLKAATFLKENYDENTYACISYPYDKTSSKYGSVKRAVCFGKDGIINDLIESSIITKDGYALAEPLDGSQCFEIPLDQSVSMNMFAFHNNFFKYLEDYFNDYFKQSDEDILKNEALLPNVVKKHLNNNDIKLMDVVTNALWLGMTYKEDLEEVKSKINELIARGEYPNKLWS